jgi:hypothetical protein
MFERIAPGHPIGAAAAAIGVRDGHEETSGRVVRADLSVPEEMRGRPRRSSARRGLCGPLRRLARLHGKAEEARGREREDHLRRDGGRAKVAGSDATIWT